MEGTKDEDIVKNCEIIRPHTDLYKKFEIISYLF